MTAATKRRPVRLACPDAAAHTPCPTGYVAWHEWAAKKAKTHRQVHCPSCGRLEIWVPKAVPLPADETPRTP